MGAAVFIAAAAVTASVAVVVTWTHRSITRAVNDLFGGTQ